MGKKDFNYTNILVVSPHSFSICDTTGEDFGAYNAGGIAIQVKVSQRRQFV